MAVSCFLSVFGYFCQAMPKLCEACERNAADSVEPCDHSEEVYHVCAACRHRLNARSLRPIEWYNLAKRHGWSRFLLHDDFYEENGEASQPEEAVERPEDFPAPKLEDVAHDAVLLLDYSITRWRLDEKTAAAWLSFNRPHVLTALSQRYATTTNHEIRSCVLEICALALQDAGADFVRYAWGDYSTIFLPFLAKASAACLPLREGFDRVTSALAVEEGSSKRDLMLTLNYFHSSEALDWIEKHIFEPITESWGSLAAASNLDWPRVEQWFEHGRPLSLVAIDALAAIVRPPNLLLRAYVPRLLNPPSPDRMRQVLSAYAELDRVPRVQKRISALLKSVDGLT